MSDLDGMIFYVSPDESPFIVVNRHNKRRLGPMRLGMRAMRRRVAKAPFKPATENKVRHEWAVTAE